MDLYCFSQPFSQNAHLGGAHQISITVAWGGHLEEWRRRDSRQRLLPDPAGTTPRGEVHHRAGWTLTTVTMPPPNVNQGADQKNEHQD